MSQFSEDQKTQHYQFLCQTIYELEHNLVDDYWLTDHIDRVKIYRFWFEDLSAINPEIEDIVFRSIAENAEDVLDRLIQDIERTSSIEADNYLELNQCLKYLTEYTLRDDDDFMDLFSKMTVSTNEETNMVEE
jgi:hypothetical protein